MPLVTQRISESVPLVRRVPLGRSLGASALPAGSQSHPTLHGSRRGAGGLSLKTAPGRGGVLCG